MIEPVGNYNLAQPFYEQVRAASNRKALWVAGQFHTYGELGRLSGKIAQWLATEGSHERVGILGTNSLASIAGIIGTCWSGAAYVPLNPSFPEAFLARQIQQAQLDALILDDAGLERLGKILAQACPKLMLAPLSVAATHPTGLKIHSAESLRAMTSPSRPAVVSENQLAYLVFTTGTTGEPKAVAVTAGNAFHFLKSMRDICNLTPEDRLSQYYRLTFDVSIFDLFMTLAAGASCYVIAEEQRRCPVKTIQEHGLTVWSSTPSRATTMHRMNALAPNIFPTLRLSIFCGEAFPERTADLWALAAPNSRIENHYGNVETAVNCFRQVYQGSSSVTAERGIVAIGRPNPGMVAAVLSPSREFLPQETPGELAVAGPQVGQGYWNDPELTARKFVTLDHPRFGRNRWYLTGDLCYEDRHGVTHYLGRIDRRIKILGHRLELEGLEACLRKFAKSDSVAALPWPLDAGSPRGIAVFIAGTAVSPEQIQDELKGLLPPPLVPKQILFLKELPLNSNGKIDYSALLNLLSSQASTDDRQT